MTVVTIVLRSNILHLVHATTLVASLVWTISRDLEKVSPLDLDSIRCLYRTTSHLTICESAGTPVQPHCNSSPADLTTTGSSIVPTRSDGRGLMSKISMPCIFPRISKRSRPVACSRSVGMVPGSAPGGSKSSSLLISIVQLISTVQSRSQDSPGSYPSSLWPSTAYPQMQPISLTFHLASAPILMRLSL